MNHREPNRRTLVEEVLVLHEKRGSPSLSKVPSEGKESPPVVWKVRLRVRDGMKPPMTLSIVCDNEEEARTFAKNHPVGSEFDQARLDYFRWMVGTGGTLLGAVDGDIQMPRRTLVDAGILEPEEYGTSQSVLNQFGKDRIEQLKARFGDEWEIVAQFEHCWKEMPHSSAAYVAAACRLHYYVLRNEFVAGYLLRDLEILVHGVESVAASTLETRKQAGKGGGAKSAQAREDRMRSLMRAIEEIVSRNPDFAKLNEEILGSLALGRAVEVEPGLWRQGKGQVAEYLGRIRRGEAGKEMQERYHAVMGTKPLRRFST
jgi:hypothetical protein